MERGEWSSDQVMLTFFTLARDAWSSQRKWRLHSSTVLGRAARWLMTERVDEAPPPVACQARRPSVNCYPSAVFLRRLLHGSRVPAVWRCPDGLHQSLDSTVGNSVLRQSEIRLRSVLLVSPVGRGRPNEQFSSPHQDACDFSFLLFGQQSGRWPAD